MLNIIKEYVTVGYNDSLLYFLFFVSIIFGIYTIIAKNPIYSILFLISLFLSVSIYLISIGLHFIGLSYLLVYVGAISILFLFIIMLMNIRVSELLTNTSNNVLLAILTTLLFYYYSYNILPFSVTYQENYNTYLLQFFINKQILTNDFNLSFDFMTTTLLSLLGMKTLIIKVLSWDNLFIFLTHIASIGNALYTNFLILFIIISLILLLAMVGVIIITTNTSDRNI